MRIEVLHSRKWLAPDISQQIEKILHPELGEQRIARDRFHALGVKFYLDGRDDLIQLSEIARDRGIKSPIAPNYGGFWELTEREKRWVRLAQAAYGLGISLRAIERIMHEGIYSPLQVRQQWYNEPLKGTLIRKIPVEEPMDREAYIRSIHLPQDVLERIRRQHTKDETDADFLDSAFELLPDDLKSFITSLRVFKEMRDETLPAYRRLGMDIPRSKTPVPAAFLGAAEDLNF